MSCSVAFTARTRHLRKTMGPTTCQILHARGMCESGGDDDCNVVAVNCIVCSVSQLVWVGEWVCHSNATDRQLQELSNTLACATCAAHPCGARAGYAPSRVNAGQLRTAFMTTCMGHECRTCNRCSIRCYAVSAGWQELCSLERQASRWCVCAQNAMSASLHEQECILPGTATVTFSRLKTADARNYKVSLVSLEQKKRGACRRVTCGHFVSFAGPRIAMRPRRAWTPASSHKRTDTYLCCKT